MKLILILCYFCFSIDLISQSLIVNAGKDRHFCINNVNSFSISPISLKKDSTNDTLGGNPSALGGKPPYKYMWTTYEEVYDKPPSIINANGFLSEDSVPNPTLKKVGYILSNPKLFFLTVIDSLGNIAKDSIYISYFHRVPISTDFVKKKEDTLAIEMTYGFYRVSSNINYHWEYTNFSSDTIGKNLRVWNNENKKIKHWITDEFGCKSSNYDISFRIDENVSIESTNIQSVFFYINEKNELIAENLNRFLTNNYKLLVYNIEGKMIYNNKISEIQFPFQIRTFLPNIGAYFIQVVDYRTGNLKFSRKFLFKK